MSIQEICENTKMGREMALLGNYETAQVYYQGVLQQIQKMLLTIKDDARKQKWQQMRQDIAQEFENVKDINSTLSSFKSDHPARPMVTRDDTHYDEPTRDKDVWPPPTPVDHKPSPPLRGGVRAAAPRRADPPRGNARPSGHKAPSDARAARASPSYGNVDRRGRENRDARPKGDKDKDRKVGVLSLELSPFYQKIHPTFSLDQTTKQSGLLTKAMRRSLIHLAMTRIW